MKGNKCVWKNWHASVVNIIYQPSHSFGIYIYWSNGCGCLSGYRQNSFSRHIFVLMWFEGSSHCTQVNLTILKVCAIAALSSTRILCLFSTLLYISHFAQSIATLVDTQTHLKVSLGYRRLSETFTAFNHCSV